MASGRSGKHACIKWAAGEVENGPAYDRLMNHGTMVVRVHDQKPDLC